MSGSGILARPRELAIASRRTHARPTHARHLETISPCNGHLNVVRCSGAYARLHLRAQTCAVQANDNT
eukprot:5648271-Alexandrium_andersonii.AAC.1